MYPSPFPIITSPIDLNLIKCSKYVTWIVNSKLLLIYKHIVCPIPGVSRAGLRRQWHPWRVHRLTQAPSCCWSTTWGRGNRSGSAAGRRRPAAWPCALPPVLWGILREMWKVLKHIERLFMGDCSMMWCKSFAISNFGEVKMLKRSLFHGRSIKTFLFSARLPLCSIPLSTF